jgi:signal transduction histidine kinase
MFILPYFFSLPFYIEEIVDAFLLILFIVPVLYFFVLKPMQSHITAQRNLEKMIFEIEEREQKRIGQRLHDSLGQILTGIAFQSKVLERKLEKHLPEEARYAADITSHVNSAANEARLLAKDLRSIGTEEDSLIFALSDLATVTEKIYSIQCTFSHDEDIVINNKAAITHLYRIAQEAVANAIRHGNPSNIDISLNRNYESIELKVRDDGSGFDKTYRQSNGMGIQMMSYRAHTIDATLEIQLSGNDGVIVTCTFVDKE